MVLCQHSPSSSAEFAHILVCGYKRQIGLQRIELYTKLFSMFQEECQAQILGEHIGNVLHSGNSEYFDFTFFDLFLNV